MPWYCWIILCIAIPLCAFEFFVRWLAYYLYEDKDL